MKPRRRTIIKIIAWLVAGLAINVAVAWGLATWVDRGKPFGASGRGSVRDEDVAVWRRHPEPGGAESRPAYYAKLYQSRGLEIRRVTGANVNDQKVAYGSTFQQRRDARYDHLQLVIAGWPLPALRGESWHIGATLDAAIFDPGWIKGSTSQPKYRFGAVEFTRPQSLGGVSVRVLPLLPVWPGFAINTLFYAGVLWVLFCGPFALRRMIRRRRGQCARCAYPIGTSPLCTECGAAVVPAQAGTQ